MFKKLISLTVIFSMLSFDLVRAMEPDPDDEKRHSRRLSKSILPLDDPAEGGEEEQHLRQALETLRTQKTDLDQRQEELARQEMQIRQDLKEIESQKQFLLQERQKQEEADRQWQEAHKREEAKRQEELTAYQHRIEEDRLKREKEDSRCQRDFEKKEFDFQVERRKLDVELKFAQSNLQKLEALEKKLQQEQTGLEERIRLLKEEIAKKKPDEEKSDDNLQRARVEEKNLQSRQENLKEERARIEASCRHVEAQQVQLRQEQEAAAREELQRQAQRRALESRLSEEAAAHLRQLEEAHLKRVEEDSRYQENLNRQNEEFLRQEAKLLERETADQETLQNISLLQKTLEGEQRKLAENLSLAQEKLDGLRLSSSPGSRSSLPPSSSPEKEASSKGSPLNKKKQKSRPSSDEKTRLLAETVEVPSSQGSIQESGEGDDNLIKSFVILDREESSVNYQKRKKPFFPKPAHLVFTGEVPTLLEFLASSINSAQEKEGLGVDLNPNMLNNLLEALENLSPQAKVHLKRITNQDIEGKLTIGQWAGILLGTGIAGWLVRGMMEVVESEILSLDIINRAFPVPIVSSASLDPILYVLVYFYYLTIYTAWFIVIPTVTLDACPRNAHFWKKTLTTLNDGAFSKKRAATIALISFWPSILEPFYLILFDLYVFNEAKQNGFLTSTTTDHGYDYIKDILAWTWPLLIDSWAANSNFAGDIWDDLKPRLILAKKYLAQHLFKRALHAPIPSPEEHLRHDFTKKLDKLALALYHNTFSKETLDVLYDAVQHAKAEIQEKLPDLQGESLDSAQGFFTLRYLLATSDQVQEIRQRTKSWYASLTQAIIGFNLIAGSPARLLVFELIVESITNLVPGNSNALRSTINWSLALGISIIQTVFEAYGMKAFFKNFLAQENPHGHTIYKGARIPAKIYAGILAFIYTNCLLTITTFLVCITWELDSMWMIGAIPFLFAEFATQAAGQWGWSTQQEVSLFARIQNRFTRPKLLKKRPRTQFKRDELVELVKTLKGRIPYLHPQVLQMLQQTLNGGDTSKRRDSAS